MILTNLSKRDKISPPDIRKLFSITKTSSTHEMKELTIYGKLHRQINTSLSVCLPTTTHIFNHWLTVVLMVDLLVSILLLSIRPPTGMSTSEASIIMRLLHFPLLPFSLWNIQMLDQSSSLCTGMYIMERVRPSIPLWSLIGMIMTLITNQVRWIVVSNRYSAMRDTLSLPNCHEYFHIFLCAPIIQHSGSH